MIHLIATPSGISETLTSSIVSNYGKKQDLIPSSYVVSETLSKTSDSIELVHSDSKRSKKKHLVKVRAKWRGVVVSIEGKFTCVQLQKDGKMISYKLLTEALNKNKISKVSQPFEMSEIEVTLNGQTIFGTAFKPIAVASSVKVTPLKLSKELEEKRTKVVSTFQKHVKD